MTSVKATERRDRMRFLCDKSVCREQTDGVEGGGGCVVLDSKNK